MRFHVFCMFDAQSKAFTHGLTIVHMGSRNLPARLGEVNS